MFPNPNMPDFESMSQEELIAWLETLAKRQSEEGGGAQEFNRELDPLDPELLPDLLEEEEWSAWIEEDEHLRQDAPPAARVGIPEAVQIEDEKDDDETPTALTTIEEGVGDETTDPLTWLEDMSTESELQELPVQPEPVEIKSELEDLGDLVAEDALEDPLDWLESLANEVRDTAGTVPAESEAAVIADLIDDVYEDDETLDDREDESLYSHRVEESMAFLESLLALKDDNGDAIGERALPPIPDFLSTAVDEQAEIAPEEAQKAIEVSATSADKSPDNLTHAFLMQDQQADLEAWYAARLRAVATAADTATKPQQTTPSRPSALQAPPPGLAAGFNSARDKVEAGNLDEALADYETLLRANIGLDLVAGDMQWLLAQERYRDDPVIHRVLGDALMRQGNLQQALDTYRHALKLL